MTRHWLAVILLCSAALLLYFDTLSYPFVYDDLPNITKKAEIRLARLDARELRAAAFSWPCPRRPLANLSFAFDYYRHGYDVRAFRAINIAIHAVNGVLVYFLSLALLRRAAVLTGQRTPRIGAELAPPAALLGALIFVTHPVQLQSVVYVVQRMNSLAAMFHLSALLLYLLGRRTPATNRRLALFAASAVSWALALGSKETALVLPIAVLLCEWFFFQDLRTDWLRSRKTVLMGALVALALITWALAGSPLELLRSTYEGKDFTPLERLLTQLRVVPFYASLVALPWPSRLNLLHDFETSRSLVEPWTTLLSLGVLALAIAIAIRAAPKARLLSFWALWCFVHLAIESSVIGLEMVFEYRLYLPMVGCASIVAALPFHLASRTSRWVGVAVASVLVLSLAIATHAATRVWRDEMTLWSTVVARSPRSHVARVNLGLALAGQGRLDEAIEQYRESIRIRPDYEVAHNDLGAALRSRGELEEAIEHFLEATRIRPRYPNAHFNLADALASAGKLQQAVRHYEEALRMEPAWARAHHKLAILLDRLGRRQEAIEHLFLAVRLAPRESTARGALSELLTLEGRGEEARRILSGGASGPAN